MLALVTHLAAAHCYPHTLEGISTSFDWRGRTIPSFVLAWLRSKLSWRRAWIKSLPGSLQRCWCKGAETRESQPGRSKGAAGQARLPCGDTCLTCRLDCFDSSVTSFVTRFGSLSKVNPKALSSAAAGLGLPVAKVSLSPLPGA